jgi:hypothetical protein
MSQFAIIEVDDGLTVAELQPGAMLDDVALEQGGFVVDPGPYLTYEDAYDAMLSLATDDEDEDLA